MRWWWRRRERPRGDAADFAQVEASAARMREALAPLNEQLHGLASHISSIRAALATSDRDHGAPQGLTALEEALATAEASYEDSLRTRDGILRQAQELQSEATRVRAHLGSLASRDACAQAAREVEERVRRELDALNEATSRLQARLELSEP